jgi:hypothetical protein
MGQVQGMKTLLETKGVKMEEHEVRAELDRLGMTYFNEYWRKKQE